jgi:[ribosomal protein S5]-alanine N-acetyltransferase
MPWEAVEAIVRGERLGDWAEDYPAEGDSVIARLLHRTAASDELMRSGAVFVHYQVVERTSGAVIGGIGFFGPPEDGVAEIGYGIVPSRQGAGFATEAVVILVSAAWEQDALEVVVAETDADNVASQRVLEKVGFVMVPGGATLASHRPLGR